jgi:hypothetical protein
VKDLNPVPPSWSRSLYGFRSMIMVASHGAQELTPAFTNEARWHADCESSSRAFSSTPSNNVTHHEFKSIMVPNGHASRREVNIWVFSVNHPRLQNGWGIVSALIQLLDAQC